MSNHNHQPDTSTSMRGETASRPSSSPSSPRRRLSMRARIVVMSAAAVAVISYAAGVVSTAAPETDEGAAFGVCVMLAPGVDGCRDDDGTLVLGDGLGVDGLPLFSTAPAYTVAQ